MLKNNTPTAVIISPDEYSRLVSIEEDYRLLMEADARIQRAAGEPTLSMAESMAEFGISQDDIDVADDLELE